MHKKINYHVDSLEQQLSFEQQKILIKKTSNVSILILYEETIIIFDLEREQEVTTLILKYNTFFSIAYPKISENIIPRIVFCYYNAKR